MLANKKTRAFVFVKIFKNTEGKVRAVLTNNREHHVACDGDMEYVLAQAASWSVQHNCPILKYNETFNEKWEGVEKEYARY